MNASTFSRTTTNKQLIKLTANRFFEQIPFQQIAEIVEANNSKLVDIDGTNLETLFLCGDSGHTLINLRGQKRDALILEWYRMPSGRYEINTYVTRIA